MSKLQTCQLTGACSLRKNAAKERWRKVVFSPAIPRSKDKQGANYCVQSFDSLMSLTPTRSPSFFRYHSSGNSLESLICFCMTDSWILDAHRWISHVCSTANLWQTEKNASEFSWTLSIIFQLLWLAMRYETVVTSVVKKTSSYLLGRDVKWHSSQVDFGKGFDARQNKEDSWKERTKKQITLRFSCCPFFIARDKIQKTHSFQTADTIMNSFPQYEDISTEKFLEKK